MATLLKYFSVENSANTASSLKRKRGDENEPELVKPDFSPDMDPAVWTQQRDYYEMFLGQLKKGPKRVTFVARVVNVYHSINKYAKNNDEDPSKRSGKGFLKLLVGDWSGSLLIHLWYLDVQYDIHLGSLIAVWATHVSEVKPIPSTGTVEAEKKNLKISIFPEKDRGCFVRVIRHDLGTVSKERNLLQEGSLIRLNEVGKRGKHEKGKVLVYVKAVGITYKELKGSEMIERCDVGIADDSSESILSLMGYISQSARRWVPNSTVLLLSDMSWAPGGRRAYVAARSSVEVDPNIDEAEWLRKYARYKAQYVNEEFPENVFKIEAFKKQEERWRFTLAEIDECARLSPKDSIMGYVCVMITEVNLVDLFKNSRLFCAECCNMPIFANSTSGNCTQCESDLELRINPRIVGSLTDETASISCETSEKGGSRGRALALRGSSPLLWSPAAWQQLLGREPAALLLGQSYEETMRMLLILESLIVYSRITILFGWSAEVGKLAVCEVLRG